MSDKTFNYSLPFNVGSPLEQIAKNAGRDPNAFLVELVNKYLDRVQELRIEIQKGADDIGSGQFRRVSTDSHRNQLVKDIIEKGKEKLADGSQPNA
ncbi:MAG: hypothetical protein IPM63_11605 [Acidobacteriota bacterium]|nr:MAG: hypothetical protein IPM63_11605 [Acidobacteriota bacterium]